MVDGAATTTARSGDGASQGGGKQALTAAAAALAAVDDAVRIDILAVEAYAFVGAGESDDGSADGAGADDWTVESGLNL